MAKFTLALVLCILMVVAVSRATTEQDEEECADQLQNLASCIPYVSGSAKKPTQQCCDDTVKVRSNKPKCLCVLIKDSTDPSLALPINTTLALPMSSACKIDAKVSDCPAILKLPPDSPDAKIFQDATSHSTTPSSTPASSSSSTAPPSISSSSDSKAAPTANKSTQLAVLEGAGLAFLLASIAWMVV